MRKIAQLALKEKYEFVDCVGEEESTHQHVPQQYVVCPHQQQVWFFVFLFGGIISYHACDMILGSCVFCVCAMCAYACECVM